MKQGAIVFVLVTVLGVGMRASAADVRIEKEAVVDSQQVARMVEVDGEQMQDDGTVTGTVVNRSANPVREVKLAIQYSWLWKNEMHPGEDDPGHADFYAIPDEIPPGGRVRFTYRPTEPPPMRRDGHFEAEARVISLVSMERPGTAMERPATTTAP